MSAPPVISVILVCKNPGPRLQAALESVWAQQNASCELIVIDGGSTDGTREWLEAQRGRLAAFISEADTGAYAAMNKGVRFARGNWLLFLGADDRLAGNDVLARIAAQVAPNTTSVYAGEAVYSDGRIYRPARRLHPIFRNFVHHQAAFYHRALFAGTDYDATLTCQADYDLNLRLWRSGVRFIPLQLRVTDCAARGLSDAGHWINYREEIAIRHRHFPAAACWFWDALSVVRYLRKLTLRTIGP
jgi:glycosyltransferase involved in cell wall biosynthesis